MTAKKSHYFSVLVIDADNATRFAASDSLKDAGFDTIEAKNAKQAFMYFNQLQPSLVLMDLELPDMSGIDLCAEIRRNPANRLVPIMMMTDSDDVESIIRAYDAGATDFISKPLNHLVLEQRTRYLLRSNQVFRSLEQKERMLEQAERIAQLGSWEWSGRDKQLLVSKECNRILGFPEDHRPTVKDVLNSVPEVERRKLIKHFNQPESGQQGSVTLQHRLSNGSGITRVLRHEAQFRKLNQLEYDIYGTIHDITEEVTHKDQILQLAYYDSLTGIPNRTFFKTHLEKAIKTARKKGYGLAVLVLDLDLFARINNSLGHEAGDELLRKVSNRLLQCFPDQNCTKLNMSAIDPQAPDEAMTNKIARLEGDQFAVLIHRFDKLDDIILMAQKLFKQLTSSFTLHGNNVVLTASAGIALYPVNGQGAEMLLRNADAALHFAKSQGRNNFHFYSSDIDFKSKERLSIESDLRHAIRNDELELHYQPKVHLKSQSVHSVEALVRWNHPIRGMVSPAQFVPMAEEIGLINELGVWLIKQACQQARQWNQSGIPPIRIAINLSPIQIRAGTLASDLSAAIAEYQIAPSQLEVEITETVLLEDSDRVLRTLEAIRSLGVKVALDDFGTGYSALSYLTRFPFNTLKIDRSFVCECVKKGHSAAIVHTIIQLCKNLNLEVVAEGVETEEELKFLLDHRCDLIQGFYFSPALNPRGFELFLQQQPWLELLDDI